MESAHSLFIDLETYSSVDLKTGGLYRYVQAPDFQILLVAWSLDDAPVEVIDLTEPDAELPDELVELLYDSNTIKYAHNAQFEWKCLQKHLELDADIADDWLPQWRCTMLHALYCGYPASLAAAGLAIGLPDDKAKLSAGKALIRYFCKPCEPTKTNGGRTRNLKHHEPEKWELFVEYCRQDVIAEMQIEQLLSPWPVPSFLQKQWETDIRINARGIAVDMEFVNQAELMGRLINENLMSEAREITGLSNPNSVTQLTEWLNKALTDEDDAATANSIAVNNLRKDTVTQLLGGDLDSPEVRRILEIRRELGKTSTKKYIAMQNTVCLDGRIHGLLQFYGANRTGRWAGRLVQVQNLPKTNLYALDTARAAVKGLHTALLKAVYGNIPSALSQLVRTAFVPRPGCVFLDADFSAIEARVIAWLADERWRLEVFEGDGKIYEASAAQMFGVPVSLIVKDRPEYALRSKGKVAELALGYQGGVNALIQMGALAGGLTTDELPDIVSRWRAASPNIVSLWYAFGDAAVCAVESGTPQRVRDICFALEGDADSGQSFLAIQLPSGRKLFYAQPGITKNAWGRAELRYLGGSDKSAGWRRQHTYGGKLTENIVQAIARDCLAVAIERVAAAGYQIVAHVHDEIIIETPEDDADLDAVCSLMSEPIDWAPGLKLRADGWIGDYYTKG